MRRYLLHLIVLTLILVVVSFILLWTSPQLFIVSMPLTALYFAVITGLQHHLVVRAANKDARKFVKSFLGVTVATLLLHLAVMSTYMFTHLQTAYLFVVAFAICYFVFLAFETVELVAYVKNYQKQTKK